MILEPVDLPEEANPTFVWCALIRIEHVLVYFASMQSTLARFIQSSTPSTVHVSTKEVIGDQSAGDDDDERQQNSEKDSSESDNGSVHTEEVPTSSDILTHLPSCWNRKMWLDKKHSHPWLICVNHKLGCSTCKELPSLGVDATKNIHLSHEWQSVTVSACGKSKEKQLMSLRNKIRRHSQSKAHTQARKIKLQASKETIESSIATMNKSHFSATEKLFRIAYKIGKTGRPFTDLPVDCDIHVLNGVDIGRTLQSDKSRHNVCDHIGKEMCARICKIIIESESKISVLIDEATSISKKSTLIIYIKTCFSDGLEPVTFYLDLVELPAQNAECIYTSLLRCLEEHGFSSEILSNRLIGIRCILHQMHQMHLMHHPASDASPIASCIRWCFCNVWVTFWDS